MQRTLLRQLSFPDIKKRANVFIANGKTEKRLYFLRDDWSPIDIFASGCLVKRNSMHNKPCKRHSSSGEKPDHQTLDLLVDILEHSS